MKKVCAWILGLMLILSTAAACAKADSLFEALAVLEWSFSSGVGGWSTEMRMLADGSFSGEYHDSEMGESADDYPNGTVYGCSFSGQMAVMEQIDENTWKILIEQLALDEGQVPEAIEDGIRFVTVAPYGLSEEDEMILYAPGTPVSALSEDMLFWAHVLDRENPPAELDTWFLSSENNESGFVGYSFPDGIALANPWEDVTQEELLDASGLFFGIPEGAENILYRFLPSEHLAEMQFTLGNDEFCARIQPAALEEGQLMNIAGMYFAWQDEAAVTVRHCSGIVGKAQTGSEDWVELCLWYDLAPGLMYSLSVYTADPDRVDLAAIAEQICIPVQGDSF